MADSPNSKVVEEVLRLLPLGQTGIVKHVLAAFRVASDSPAMAAVVLAAASAPATDQDCARVLNFLVELFKQQLHQL